MNGSGGFVQAVEALAIAGSPRLRAYQARIEGCRRESALFNRAMGDVEGACGFAVRALLGGELTGDLADHHWAWLQGAVLACVGQLYEVEEAAELKLLWDFCNQASGIQAFDPPGRYAVTGATSVGKTIVCAAVTTQTASHFRADGRLEPGVRGIVYCASSVQLLADMRDHLLRMGVPLDVIGIRYYDKKAEYREIIGTPSITADEMNAFPVLLVTQSFVNNLSKDILRCSAPDGSEGLEDEPEDEDEVEEMESGVVPVTADDRRPVMLDLLEHGGRRRLGLWDEAFASYGTLSFNLTDLKLACQAIDERLRNDEKGLDRDELIALDALQELYGSIAAEKLEAGRHIKSSQTQPPFIYLSPAAANGIRKLRPRLNSKLRAYAETLSVLLRMRSTYVRCWAVPSEAKAKSNDADKHRSGGGRVVHLVQPTPRVDPTIDRVLVFDASYVITSVRSDSSVQLAGPLKAFDDSAGDDCWTPKLFETVRIHLLRGPSGRTTMEGDRDKRKALIHRQVSRIKAYVPDDQPFLIATFKTNKPFGRARAIDWTAEIKSELKKQNIRNWEERARFTTYGKERGLNTWADCRYGFGVGLLQRQWPTELRFLRMALSRQMDNPKPLESGERASDAVAGEMAATIQQLVGRLFCRHSFVVPLKEKPGIFPSSMAGACEFWVELYDPGSGSSKGVDVKDSTLCDRLRQVMPGVQLLNTPQPAWMAEEAPAPAVMAKAEQAVAAEQRTQSTQQWVTSTVIEWMDQRPAHVEMVTTQEINKAMLRRKPELEKSRKTLQRGVDAAKALVAARTESRWVIVGRQNWVRAS